MCVCVCVCVHACVPSQETHLRKQNFSFFSPHVCFTNTCLNYSTSVCLTAGLMIHLFHTWLVIGQFSQSNSRCLRCSLLFVQCLDTDNSVICIHLDISSSASLREIIYVKAKQQRLQNRSLWRASVKSEDISSFIGTLQLFL